MQIPRPLRILGILALAALLPAKVLAASAPAAKGADLSNAACLKCHATGKDVIQVRTADDEKRKLLAIPESRYKASIHAGMDCVACHTNIVDAKAKHSKAGELKIECGQCHLDLLAKARAEGRPPAKIEALDAVAKNVEAYRRSFHVKDDPNRPGRAMASCDECHDTHSFAVPAKDTPEYAAFRGTIPASCGSSCHEDHLSDWQDSAHGEEAQAKYLELVKKAGKVGSEKTPAVCTDCHTNHSVINTSWDRFKQQYVRECGDCHQKEMTAYRDTYHGKVHRLGYNFTAKCSDCHGSHDAKVSTDKDSRMHVDRRLKQCKTCHDGKKRPLATEGFKTFGAHANAYDREKYPQVWWIGRVMMAILFGTFIFFWVHCILWWRREYPRGMERRTHHRVKGEAVPEATGKTHVRRFDATWRVLHLAFALSLMTLAATGMTVLSADTPWAPVVADLFGGPKVMALVHRIAAVVFLAVFVLHCLALLRNFIRRPSAFRPFGPDSLVPNLKDFKDCYGMFRWFLRRGPKPVFDRWAYWEKFDYWAAIWGVFIIGLSGLVLWFPTVTAQYMPGWVFNVATMVHGIEAFIAIVFLFTVHFFNNHFRPDKLPPPDITMFTGTVALDEFRREHGAHYQRLVDSGELKDYLVEAPSAGLTTRSRWLGYVLLAMGLVLLVFVLHGVSQVGLLPG